MKANRPHHVCPKERCSSTQRHEHIDVYAHHGHTMSRSQHDKTCSSKPYASIELSEQHTNRQIRHTIYHHVSISHSPRQISHSQAHRSRSKTDNAKHQRIHKQRRIFQIVEQGLQTLRKPTHPFSYIVYVPVLLVAPVSTQLAAKPFAQTSEPASHQKESVSSEAGEARAVVHHQ